MRAANGQDIGAILTMLSKFWFDLLQTQLPDIRSHFVSLGLPDSLKRTLSPEHARDLQHRSMIVQRLEMLPVESICRGYISGMLFGVHQKGYTFSNFAQVRLGPRIKKTSLLMVLQYSWYSQVKVRVLIISVTGIKLPPGLRESDLLPEIIWTPSTKASRPGEHDENIGPEKVAELVGDGYASQIESLTRRIYSMATTYAASRGIIIADIKLELYVK